MGGQETEGGGTDELGPGRHPMTSQASLREPVVVCQTQAPKPPFPGNSAKV